MREEKLHSKLVTRRVAMLGIGKLVLLGALGGRLYYLQVHEAERYRTLADENRINLRLLPPPRGHIVDRNGIPMAVNVQNYRVLVVPEQAEDLDATLERLEQMLPLPEGMRRRVMREAKRKRAFVPITVKENLTWEEVSRVEVNSPDLPGITIDVGQTRAYPYQFAAAHVLGYVAAVSESEMDGDPVLELPGFRIGKSGIEKQHDLTLRGTAGNSQVEVNALGRVIRELRRQEGQPGRPVTLTLDMELQQYTFERIAPERAAAVVAMDAHNGDVLVMASVPSFDPNAFNEGLTSREWRALMDNPDAPLTNKAVAGQYAPGSVFKIAVALAALEQGVSPDFRAFCAGHIDFGDQRFHCWKKHGHGHVALIDAMRESCDVYFYELAQRLGIDRIAEMAQRLGLGTELGIDLPGEAKGLIPTREWKRRVLGVPWQRGETLVASIGQGYVLTTPLQLAVMTARAVNGGYAVRPHLTRIADASEPGESSGPRFPSIGLSAQAQAILRQGLDEVVNAPSGTARRAAIDDARFAMGGKTGTAQVRRITMAEREKGVRKNEDRPWRERDHALFVGCAPISAPRYVVSVVVEHGGSGSTTAAPIARDVLLELQRRQAVAQGEPLSQQALAGAPPSPERP
ncbi:MAG: penicillin-binding protein 2 [Alphaproteobacteria bacterium]